MFRKISMKAQLFIFGEQQLFSHSHEEFQFGFSFISDRQAAFNHGKYFAQFYCCRPLPPQNKEKHHTKHTLYTEREIFRPPEGLSD